MTQSIAVVIVNYKTADLTISCLQSLCNQRKQALFEVVVVDNDSQDNSLEKLLDVVNENAWHDWVKITDSGHNGGFSYGNNIAIREFLANDNPPEFIYLLNPDTFVREGSITALQSFLKNNPKVGIVGGRLEDPDGTPQHSSFKFHNWLTELDRGFSLGVISALLKNRLSSHFIPDISTKTDWVAGASMMIRARVFKDIGLLDESYFMYYEEMDFCLQAARSGWECWYVPDSHVVHYVGQSSGVTDTKKVAKRRPLYWFDSRRRFFLKNYGLFHTAFADICWLIGFSAWRIRNIFQKKTHNHPPYFLFDTLMNSVFVKGFGVRPVKND